MNKFRFTIKLLVIATFMLAFASIAQAQASRTWVSGVGDDANPCSRTAPCKTWAGAISKTAPCGEIDALDPGGFGAVTITKSITLDGTGTFASILVSGTNAIVIQAATTDVVTIRGLSINGICTGINGILINQAKVVNVEDTVIFRFTTSGISTINATAAIALNVRNSVIRDITGDGVITRTTSGQVKGMLVNSSFNGNVNGLHAEGGSRISADHCIFSGNSSNGVFAEGISGVGVANITNSSINNNGTNGVQAATGGSVARINNCDIYQNGGNGALVGGGGEVDTFGNNRILANGTDGCPSCTGKGVS